MIRHNHELDREAAKLIREGEGREALALYRSAERVMVAPDAEARREAMVADWWRSFGQGEDALMVAKRNTEVERLNATAREADASRGRLGAQEIEVGEARFAAGDQVITRVNDRQRRHLQPRALAGGRGRPRARRIVFDGIDQARRVEVGPDYLAKTSRRRAPALSTPTP